MRRQFALFDLVVEALPCYVDQLLGVDLQERFVGEFGIVLA